MGRENKPGYNSFLGKGWSFPPEFNDVTGEVKISSDEDDIEASLIILLGTTAGERLMHPTYGLNLRELLFEPMTTTMQTLLIDRIKTVLLVHEPRIKLLSLKIDTSSFAQNEGRLEIIIEYEIRATNSRFNLVYPFYLNDGSEVNDRLAAGT